MPTAFLRKRKFHASLSHCCIDLRVARLSRVVVWTPCNRGFESAITIPHGRRLGTLLGFSLIMVDGLSLWETIMEETIR